MNYIITGAKIRRPENDDVFSIPALIGISLAARQ